MTLADIEKIPGEYLKAEDIAHYLNANPNTIRWQAKHEPELLGFPVIKAGKNYKFPKAAFLYIMRYGKPQITLDVRPEAIQYYIDQAMESILSIHDNKGA